MAIEEIRGVTWDLWGPELKPWQAAQRLYSAGFKDADLLATMWAIMESESGGYLKAWHHNVKRNEDGSIFKAGPNLMQVNSTDLGFIQKNVVHDPPVILGMTNQESTNFVNDLFEEYPALAHGDESAKIAFELYKQRGFQPWYAYTNGHYKKSMGRACLAVGNFLAAKNGLRPKPYLKRIEP